MKPGILVISAWGSYKDQVEINFDDVQKSGLFVITGPTGAGKTTIFDAIMFALFGELSGSLRESGSVRSDFAEPGRKTFVSLTFTHRGEEYTIDRNPVYLRPKQKGDGFTKEREQAKLQLPDGTVVEGRREADEKIKRILGLSGSQFKQVSMIAQGEFVQLLLAKSDKRRDIFRKLFHLQIYDRVRQLAGQNEKQLGVKIAILKTRMKEAVASVLLDTEEWQELSGQEFVQDSKIESYLAERLEEDKKERQAVREQIRQQDGEITKLIRKIEEAKRLLRAADEYQKALDEKKRLDEQKDEIKQLEKAAAAGDRAARVYPFVHVFQTDKNRLDALGETLAEAAGALKKDREQLAKAREAYSEKDKYKEQLNAFKQELERLEKAIEIQTAYVSQQEQLEKSQLQCQKKQESLQRERNFYQQEEQRYISGVIGLAAKELKDGQPCPVCGSLHHPDKAAISEDVPDKEALDRQKSALEKTEAELQEMVRSAAGLKGIVEEKVKSYHDLLSEMPLEADLSPQRSEYLQRIEETGKTLAEICSRYEQLNLETEKKEAALVEMKKQQEELEKETALHQKEMEEKLKEESIRNLSVFEQIQIAPGELERIRLQIRDHQEQSLRTKETFKRLKQDVKKLEKFDREQMETEHQQRDKELKVLRRQAEQLEGRITNNQRALKAFREYYLEKQELEEDYGRIADVSGMINGKNPLHLILEDYVIASYFDDILKAANLRLAKMTDSRYELHRVAEAVSARTKDSLELEILDHYSGRYRSVKTLSGGEIFKSALALALGMSDIIQQYAGGIEVETLFIDEGFGSLDYESLNQAVDTLDSLAGSRYVIGVISHVEQLKERIENQIVVSRSSDGSRVQMKQ